MAEHTDLDHTIARGAIGAALFVMAAGHPSLLGLMREGLALKHAIKDVPDGPASELIERAGKLALGGRIQGDFSDTVESNVDSAQLEEEATSLLDPAIGALAGLPAAHSDHVRAWYVSIGQAVAEAAPDRGSKEKLTDAEVSQIGRLSSMLAID